MKSASLQTFGRILDENSIRLSRTRKGISDTASSELKHPLRLSGDALKRRAAKNEGKAQQFAWDHRDMPAPTGPHDARKVLFDLADITNDGLLPAGPLRRAWPMPGRVPAIELDRAIEAFCLTIVRRWGELPADPVPLAAWAEWELNGGSLHPFYDGCGRISRTFAALLLLQAGWNPPLYDNFDSYFAQGNRGIDAFTAYMRESVARGQDWLTAPPPAKPDFPLACYCLIRNADGEILLIQRPPDRHFPNQWELPGGKLDPAETPGQAARREALEETGLAVTPLSLVGAVEHEIKGFRVIMLILECRLDGGNLQLSDEHQAFRWTPAEQVMQLDLTPQLRKFFEAYRR